jgi:hypothetical protein
MVVHAVFFYSGTQGTCSAVRLTSLFEQVQAYKNVLLAWWWC